MRPCSVYLISSGDFGWGGLQRMLAAMDDVRVAGEATRACDALDAMPAPAPDAIIVAAVLDGVSTVPLVSGLARRCPGSRIVVMAAGLDAGAPDRFIAAGATAYLLWSDADVVGWRYCLAAVLHSDVVVGSRSAVRVLLDGHWMRRRLGPAGVTVSARERLVLHRLATGATEEDIAREERVSVRTVEGIVARLKVKLGAPSLYVLGVKAVLFGHVSLDELPLA